MLGHRLYGKRLGIIGMGRIGQSRGTARRGFGMAIHYHNRRRRRPETASRPRGDLLGKPRPDDGAHGHDLGPLPAHAGDVSTLLSGRRLKLLKPTSLYRQPARGEI